MEVLSEDSAPCYGYYGVRSWDLKTAPGRMLAYDIVLDINHKGFGDEAVHREKHNAAMGIAKAIMNEPEFFSAKTEDVFGYPVVTIRSEAVVMTLDELKAYAISQFRLGTEAHQLRPDPLWQR